jgi:hypothetical protein
LKNKKPTVKDQFKIKSSASGQDTEKMEYEYLADNLGKVSNI